MARLGSPWTRADEQQLTLLWGEHPLKEIARRLGRNVHGVYFHARKIGLRCGAPQGTEYIWHAANRTGFSVKQLRRIFEIVGGVRERPAMTRPSGRRSYKHSCVVPLDVDDAIAKFISTRETLSEAARRFGIKPHTLRRRLAWAGVDAPEHCMPTLDRAVVDRVMRMETIKDAAARLGCYRNTLLAALIDAGAKKVRPRYWMLDPEEYDRALAGYRERIRNERRRAA